MTNQKLPENWEYTGRNVKECLETTGVVERFYQDSEIKDIYTIKKLARVTRGLLNSKRVSLETHVKYVRPDRPNRVLPSGDNYRYERVNIAELLRDKEVYKK